MQEFIPAVSSYFKVHLVFESSEICIRSKCKFRPQMKR